MDSGASVHLAVVAPQWHDRSWGGAGKGRLAERLSAKCKQHSNKILLMEVKTGKKTRTQNSSFITLGISSENWMRFWNVNEESDTFNGTETENRNSHISHLVRGEHCIVIEGGARQLLTGGAVALLRHCWLLRALRSGGPAEARQVENAIFDTISFLVGAGRGTRLASEGAALGTRSSSEPLNLALCQAIRLSDCLTVRHTCATDRMQLTADRPSTGHHELSEQCTANLIISLIFLYISYYM